MGSQLHRIYMEAVQLPLDQRGAYLDGACADDPSLRDEVSLLLSEEVLPRTDLLRRAVGITLLTTPAEVLPIRLERFELQSRVGEGSFGVVYAPQQHTPVQRRVAIKVLRPGIDTAQIVNRFDAERQALASLDHPNIAHLFDAGNMPDGRPFFVMEWIDGKPITSYCDSHRLTIRQRLELFL